ncbi:MAG: NADH-quinone oxidoreductase subunit M [Deltaproteobacteria bacterium]|nr:NADH-quinone oxidoreductase subunit M [Deltaproteobacteria bacterium]MBP7288720.1 NADH-quinone oxidoreductase subunit M [Nannocystaceae bacterium]
MTDVLTMLLIVPMLGALVVATLPSGETRLAQGVGLAIAVLEFLISIPLATGFVVGEAGMQFETKLPWIRDLGIHYHVGVDGFSLWVVVLTTLLTPLCIWGAWRSIEKRGGEFVVAMLVLETGMIGTLVALDMILFFVFWELMLVPMALIIGIWGSEQRVAAAVKFFLYTMVGSALMLAAIIYLAVQHHTATRGVWSFDYNDLSQVVLTPEAQFWCFWAFVLSFAIKVPLFPVHTWLPDAHTQAPTPGSVILAGVLLKLGTYGLLRFAYPLFPLAAGEGSQLLAILAVVGIVYGALVAWVQSDAKRLVAYSSVSHMGFIVLGITSFSTQGLTGATYQSLAHGLTTGALFMAIGVLYERRHTRLISEFGGLAKPMPIFAAMFMIAMLGSAGVPGLVGFVGEFLIMVGTFTHGGLTLYAVPILVVVAATGVILGVVYLLHLFQKLMFGPLSNPKNVDLPDLNLREILVFVPFVALIVLMGLYPRPFTARIDPTSQAAVAQFNLKRCASIFNANGDGPMLLAELVDRCPDPEARIAATYGDERPAEAAKASEAKQRAEAAAQEKAAREAATKAAAQPTPGAGAQPVPTPGAAGAPARPAGAPGAVRPPAGQPPGPPPGTAALRPAPGEPAPKAVAPAPDRKADAKAGGNP